MKIGYLHIGSHKHGGCRYGRILAAEARRRPNLAVIEAYLLILTENGNTIESCWSRRLSAFRRRKLFTCSAIGALYDYLQECDAESPTTL